MDSIAGWPSRYFAARCLAGLDLAARASVFGPPLRDGTMDAEQRELLRLLFAEATARIEAAHESAVAGQSAGLAVDDYAGAARRLRAAAQDVAALAEAARSIAADRPDDAGSY